MEKRPSRGVRNAVMRQLVTAVSANSVTANSVKFNVTTVKLQLANGTAGQSVLTHAHRAIGLRVTDLIVAIIGLIGDRILCH